MSGIPFLAPWANRMPEGFWANGRRYLFNPGLASIRPDQNGIPIHGLLTASPFWELVRLGSDETSACVTSRLEFWKYPDLMANWPFAHEYEMTYRLSAGSLEVSVTVTNRSADPMPVAIGFHPYFQLPDVPDRRSCRTYSRPLARRNGQPSDSDGRNYAGRFRRSACRSTITISTTDSPASRARRTAERFSTSKAASKKIEVTFGPKYRVAIVYAPPGQELHLLRADVGHHQWHQSGA